MAVRRKIRHDDETRAKIQAAQIINRMYSCVMGEITLDAQQVSCAKALLNKVLPDLASVDHSGNTQQQIEVIYRWIDDTPIATDNNHSILAPASIQALPRPN